MEQTRIFSWRCTLMDQVTFSDLEYQHNKRKTRREKILEKMELLIPWEKLEKKVRRYCPRAGRGRHPYLLSVMLRIHCVPLFYNVGDPAMEDMLYEIDSIRRFVGLKITGPIPDASTILKFRQVLESHGLGTKLFEVTNHQITRVAKSNGRLRCVPASAPCSLPAFEPTIGPNSRPAPKKAT